MFSFEYFLVVNSVAYTMFFYWFAIIVFGLSPMTGGLNYQVSYPNNNVNPPPNKNVCNSGKITGQSLAIFNHHI